MGKENAQEGRPTRPRQPTHVYVPANFDPEAILPPELRRYADCARYFLHRIMWGQVMRRRAHDDYVPIKFDYLRAVIPDRVIKPLKIALKEAKVVECNDHYTEGVESLGYRLGPRCQNAQIVRVAIGDQATAEKLRASREAEKKKVRLDVHKYLRAWYRRLGIDLPFALQLLSGHPHYELVKLPAEQIAANDHSFTLCRYGRVHTDLTQCSRRVRPALRIGGQPLVEIDVACSQPLFLGLVIINYRQHGNKLVSVVHFGKSNNQYDQIDEIIKNTIQSFSQREQEATTPPSSAAITTRKSEVQDQEDVTLPALVSNAEVADQQTRQWGFLKPDEAAFVQHCEKGTLYKFLMLWTATYSGQIQAWPVPSLLARKAAPIWSHEFDGLRSFTLTPDGARLATLDRDGAVRLFDSATKQEVLTLAHPNDPGAFSLAISPDGTSIAATFRNEVRIWRNSVKPSVQQQ